MTTNRVRALLVGSSGRMGQAVRQAAEAQGGVEIAACCERGESIGVKIRNCHVVIDFSTAEATGDVVGACMVRSVPLVIGTTGHSSEAREIIESAAKKLPIVLAPNFSVGVNVLQWLTRKTTELLGADFDIEIVEMHHRQKKDAPSGTASKLLQIVAESRGLKESEVRHGRAGDVGARSAREVGVHALRGGDVIGDHTVLFAGAGERLELTHRASSREVFALGALRAAAWIIAKPPGLYRMPDVLGLPE